MFQGRRGATALIGMPGFEVGAQVEVGGEWWLSVQSADGPVGGGECGGRATGHGRRRRPTARSCSTKVLRSQPPSSQHRWRLNQMTTTRRSPCGVSRRRTQRRPRLEGFNPAQPGQASTATTVSTVTTTSPLSPSSTARTGAAQTAPT